MIKNILFILITICMSCKGQQQILPLETKGLSIEGAYYKDLNNELDPYIGTWKGIFDNKTFIITFSKYKKYNSIGNYYQDRLAGKYKMLDSNGNILYSTYNLSDTDAKVTSLGFFNNKNKLRLLFLDLCIEGEIHLNFENTQKTALKWSYKTSQSFIVDDSQCAPYNEMPRGEFTLTKQV